MFILAAAHTAAAAAVAAVFLYWTAAAAFLRKPAAAAVAAAAAAVSFCLPRGVGGVQRMWGSERVHVRCIDIKMKFVRQLLAGFRPAVGRPTDSSFKGITGIMWRY